MSVDDRKRIAAAIRDYLARERISREEFAFKTKLGKSTVDKLLTGLFSDRTLAIVESHTKLALRAGERRADAGRGASRGRGPATARPAVDRGPALRQHERRPRAGLPRRRHHRGHHHRPGAPALALRHRAQLDLRRTRARRRMCGRSRAISGSATSWRAASGPRARASASPASSSTPRPGKHIWAEKYDRDLQDIFAVQDDITEHVVAAVEPHLYARGGIPGLGPAAGQHRRLGARRPRARPDQPGRAPAERGGPGAAAPRDRARAELRPGPCAPELGRLVGGALLLVRRTAARATGEAAGHAQDALSLDPSDPWARMVSGLGLSTAGQHERALVELRDRPPPQPELRARAHGARMGAPARRPVRRGDRRDRQGAAHEPARQLLGVLHRDPRPRAPRVASASPRRCRSCAPRSAPSRNIRGTTTR